MKKGLKIFGEEQENKRRMKISKRKETKKSNHKHTYKYIIADNIIFGEHIEKICTICGRSEFVCCYLSEKWKQIIEEQE